MADQPEKRGVTFREIKSDLLERIAAGEWAADGIVPGEVELAAEYGCARATVNRALRDLAEDGVVERKRRAGTRILAQPVRKARFDIPISRTEIEATGARYRYALVDRAIVEAPDWLRARLALDRGAHVLHLTCMHYGDGAPFQFEDRWINLSALPKAESQNFEAQGPNEWLVETVPYSDAEIAFSAIGASPDVAEHLSCDPNTPLFRIERTTWWQDVAITHVALMFRPGHRMTTRY
ncbi:MAG: GntR family transcriptional regulator [Pseudooceanicola sp.]|jgi:GntR family histidine utilization transcriptional repressor|nr:GntR family transcriptional regulator [Pseudooceanicola sp.]